jgi:hypothetical protein
VNFIIIIIIFGMDDDHRVWVLPYTWHDSHVRACMFFVFLCLFMEKGSTSTFRIQARTVQKKSIIMKINFKRWYHSKWILLKQLYFIYSVSTARSE